MGGTYTGVKFRKKTAKKMIKSKILKKSIFSDFLAIFLANCSKNRVNVNKKFLAVTRRAGCLILGSKSNTVSGKSAPGRLATYWYFFVEKVNF